MTGEELTKERNIFLAGLGGIVVAMVAVIGLFAAISSSQSQGPLVVATWIVAAASKAVSLYLVFRLSRFLGHRPWRTGLYLVLAFFPVLFWITSIALLVGVRSARRRVAAGLASPASPAPSSTAQANPAAPTSSPEACPSCGAPIPAGDRFCHSCGQAMPIEG